MALKSTTHGKIVNSKTMGRRFAPPLVCIVFQSIHNFSVLCWAQPVYVADYFFCMVLFASITPPSDSHWECRWISWPRKHLFCKNHKNKNQEHSRAYVKNQATCMNEGGAAKSHPLGAPPKAAPFSFFLIYVI